MAGKGGYQPPANPAMASGPGALSQRTDGGPTQPMMDIPDAAYGEQAEFAEIQGGAPMAGTPATPPVALNAPTERPGEPATAGMPFGPGRMPGAADMQTPYDKDMQTISKYLPMLESMAQMEEVPKTFQSFILKLRSYR